MMGLIINQASSRIPARSKLAEEVCLTVCLRGVSSEVSLTVCRIGA
jgi:hypothetical protein